MPDVWYETVEADTRLMQGDLIIDCPLIAWQPDEPNLQGTKEAEVLKGMTLAIEADVIVMTQACDLENEKVRNVILCPHLSISDFRQVWEDDTKRRGENPNSKAWRNLCDDICKGYLWNLSMLNSCEAGSLMIDHRIVDFSDVYTVPRIFLESLLRQRAQPRLRLLPPYREHLSQAFARFFMRVGLPLSVSKVW